jgi:hypothetical protein
MRCTGLTAVVLLVLMVAATATAVLSYFENVSDQMVVAGPPYPTEYHLTDVAHEASQAFERDGQLSLDIARALGASGAIVSVDLQCMCDQRPDDGFHENTSFELKYYPEPGSERTPTVLRVDLHSILTAVSGRRGTLDALHPDLPPADPSRYFDVVMTEMSAELTCRVRFDRGITHELTLLVEASAGVTLPDALVTVRPETIAGARCGQPSLADTYFTSHPGADFETTLIVETVGDVQGDQPLATLTYTGRFLGGSSPVEASSWGEIKSLYRE